MNTGNPTNSVLGCTQYPLIGAAVGGVTLVAAAILILYFVLGTIIYALFSSSFGGLSAFLLAVFGGAIATIVAVVFGGIETVGIALALTGALMGAFDGVIAWFVSLLTKIPGMETATLTAIICGVAVLIVGAPFWGPATWGLVAFCAVFNAVVGGITGSLSLEAWNDFSGNRPR